jgi:hypothetical protein
MLCTKCKHMVKRFKTLEASFPLEDDRRVADLVYNHHETMINLQRASQNCYICAIILSRLLVSHGTDQIKNFSLFSLISLTSSQRLVQMVSTGQVISFEIYRHVEGNLTINSKTHLRNRYLTNGFRVDSQTSRFARRRQHMVKRISGDSSSMVSYLYKLSREVSGNSNLFRSTLVPYSTLGHRILDNRSNSQTHPDCSHNTNWTILHLKPPLG